MPVTLCFIKDKHKVMEHKIPLETYFAGLLQKVEWQIQEYEDTAADTLTLCRLCVDYLQEILGELKNFIISYPFASTEEEIHFFKELKPLLASKIIYYNTVYKIEVRFPSGSEEVQRDYLLSETDRISKSFQRNLAFYQYHRTKATYLDRQYFMRGKPDIQIIVDSFYYETDPQFSTSHDFKVAKILANELLEIYLTNRLHELERREQRKRVKNGFMGKVLRWTGTKRALVELIYALDACGCLNKGNTLLQGTETAFSEQNHLLQHRLQDRGALPQRQRGSAKGLPAVGNRPDFKVVPAELGVLPVPPNESHLLGQAVFHAWEA